MISTCCGGSIMLTDLCSICKEHCDAECDEHQPYYQPPEPENNVQESYTCEECGEDLPYEEQDWDQEAKDRRLGI